jgi:hypothetical protein
MLLCRHLEDFHIESIIGLDGCLFIWIVEWDSTGPVLDAILRRESVLKAEADRWDVSRKARPPSPSSWAEAGDADGWGVPASR